MCEKESFGNCDPETRHQQYCIFHKPGKTREEAREFYQKILELYKPRRKKVKISGRVIERLVFDGVVNFEGFVFPEPPPEYDEPFFKNAVFEGEALFSRCVFEGYASFDNVEFRAGAWFDSVVFGSGASFYDARFREYANFDSAEFKDVIFERAIFEGKAEFVNASFKRLASFRDVVFRCRAWFRSAVFESLALFERSKFVYEVSFLDAEFKSKVVFDMVEFNGETRFEKAMFEKNVGFRGVKVEGTIDVCNGAQFRLASAEAEACRVERLFYEREGDRGRADRLFVREMRARRRAWIENAQGKLRKMLAHVGVFLEWLLVDLTCEYGTNWRRPVALWFLLVLVAFPLLYYIVQVLGLGSVVGSTTFLDLVYFSIVTATTLGYGDLHPEGVIKAAASLEAVFGTFMWAVFLTVYARKYMR